MESKRNQQTNKNKEHKRAWPNTNKRYKMQFKTDNTTQKQTQLMKHRQTRPTTNKHNQEQTKTNKS